MASSTSHTPPPSNPQPRDDGTDCGPFPPLEFDFESCLNPHLLGFRRRDSDDPDPESNYSHGLADPEACQQDVEAARILVSLQENTVIFDEKPEYSGLPQWKIKENEAMESLYETYLEEQYELANATEVEDEDDADEEDDEPQEPWKAPDIDMMRRHTHSGRYWNSTPSLPGRFNAANSVKLPSPARDSPVEPSSQSIMQRRTPLPRQPGQKNTEAVSRSIKSPASGKSAKTTPEKTKKTTITAPAKVKKTTTTAPAKGKKTTTTAPAKVEKTTTTAPAKSKKTTTTAPAKSKKTTTTAPAKVEKTTTTAAAKSKKTRATTPTTAPEPKEEAPSQSPKKHSQSDEAESDELLLCKSLRSGERTYQP